MAISADVRELLRRVATILDRYAAERGIARSQYHLQGWFREDYGRIAIAFASEALRRGDDVEPVFKEIHTLLDRELGPDISRYITVLPYAYCGPGTEPSLPGFSSTMMDVTEYLVPEPREAASAPA